MARNKPEVWRPLGYMPNLYLLSRQENQHRLDSKEKLRLYHEILEEILESLMLLQERGGLPFEFDYQGQHYKVNLKIFLLVVIGDTEGHDKFCARYNNRSLGTMRLCRHCDTPTLETDNVDYPWTHILPTEVTVLVEANDVAGLKNISQHGVRNAFYNSRLDVGGNIRGIHGMTPGEPLHVVDLGILGYSLEGFYVSLGMNPTNKGQKVKVLSHLDTFARSPK